MAASQSEPGGAETARPNRTEPMDGLQPWLERVREIGELDTISAEVDPDLEMATVAYLRGGEEGSPALMFDNIKGHPGHRALWGNIASSLRRFCVTIREEPTDDAVAIVKLLKEKMKDRREPRSVDAADAPVNANILTGDDVDITIFPAPKMWPLDGGKYIGTGDAIITRDPDTGRVNVGTYRQMVESPTEVGFWASPGKDALLHREAWWAKGKPAPVACVYGLDPLLLMVGSTNFPKNVCEYDAFGGINGDAIEVFESDETGLPLPAQAEIICEGFAYPDSRAPEGPFGEFTGYYGAPRTDLPNITFTKIRFRDNPVLVCALMAHGRANECGVPWSVSRSAKIWDDLERAGIPGIEGVWSPPEASGAGMTVISLRQSYAGHAAQALALAAQCMGGASFTKYVVAVDHDVDPTDLSDVVWAMITRSRPSQSIEILRETWSNPLDPSLNPPEIRPWGSKCLINACMEHRHIERFATRTKLSQPVYERVASRWNELGFDGEAPPIRQFQTETGVAE